MEYEGMRVEVVARGIKGGRLNSGAAFCTRGSAAFAAAGSAAAGTGAGAEGLALDLVFFLDLALPPDMLQAPIPPILQQHKQARTIHSQIGNCEPQEPEALEPELRPSMLADPEESLAHDP